jgi:pimeloyl-ACP methyl ester carboxylesterase
MMKGFPVLLLFGENDVLQPTKVAVERWKTGLASAGNRDVEVRVFAGAGHFLRQEGPNPHQPGPYVDGLLEAVDRWLDRRLLLRPPPQSPVRFPGAGALK